MEPNPLQYISKIVDSEHKDLIHDVSFDFYGTRMATCSSDHTVMVWELEKNGEWHCSSSWRTHTGSVWKITWANPEFGQILATCSFDRTVAVWEEVEAPNTGKCTWVRRANLVDSRAPVKDVKFAPKHLGLQLATCSVDGCARIYEAPDVMNCSAFSVQNQIKCKMRCSCISWNPSSYKGFKPLLAIGSDEKDSAAGGKVLIYEYNDISRIWAKVHVVSSVTEPVHDLSFAPHFGIKRHILAIASDHLHIYNLKPINVAGNKTETAEPSKFTQQEVAKFNDHTSNVWRVAWDVFGKTLASSGNDGKVMLWTANYLDNWKKVTTLSSETELSVMDADMASSPPMPNGDTVSNNQSTLGNRYQGRI